MSGNVREAIPLKSEDGNTYRPKKTEKEPSEEAKKEKE